eukprot:TRINITY_DN21920_c0_g1_i2.p2 TRINITY_DN21920_c0_g1~~TRINITY_DN21920_c0_g1_i2.p2  ORF type:complete len:118 (+),score=15.01 TRINITY_DN21920_c0_g1_i2:75-428(+)
MISINSFKHHDDIVKSSQKLCVYYKTTFCAPCQQFTPKYSGFPNFFRNVQFAICDLDDIQEETIDSIDPPICTVPTFILYLDGKEIYRLEGLPQQRPARKLSLAVRQYFLGEEIQKL